MARPDKAAAVAELVEDFKSADATVVTEYRGLTVTSIKELRRSLGIGTKYKVAKNTLVKIAAKEAGVEVDESLLSGPDRKSTRLNSSHVSESRMPSSA